MACGKSCAPFFACFSEKQHARRSHVPFFAHFPEKQHARRSRVTFFVHFSEKQHARRSRVAFFAHFSKKQHARGSRVAFFAHFPEKQHARTSCVPSQAIIPCEKAREIVLHFLKKHNIPQRWSNPINTDSQQFGSTALLFYVLFFLGVNVGVITILNTKEKRV